MTGRAGVDEQAEKVRVIREAIERDVWPAADFVNTDYRTGTSSVAVSTRTYPGRASALAALDSLAAELVTLKEAAELAVQATLPLLPLAGSWEGGYRVDTVLPQHTVSALPSEWAEAAHAIAELHRPRPPEVRTGSQAEREGRR